jgi:hypothetical protein
MRPEKWTGETSKRESRRIRNGMERGKRGLEMDKETDSDKCPFCSRYESEGCNTDCPFYCAVPSLASWLGTCIAYTFLIAVIAATVILFLDSIK